MYYVNTHIIILFVFLLILFFTGIERSIQKYKPAWFYMVAVLYFVYASVEYALYLSGISHPISMHAHPNNLEIGVIMDTIIILWASFINIISPKRKTTPY